MSDYSLSYVLTTYNKLEFAKTVLQTVIENCASDEEIVVVDGGSKDGTAEYLHELSDKKLIHQFISEKDQGEGHGFNKAILMAKGQIIKYITDDDVFDFNVIRFCKNYMLANSNIDFLNTNGANYNIEYNSDIVVFTDAYIDQMKEWMHTGKPFAFCMLGAMFNKDSLPLLGLLNPSIKRADAEYSLRITSQKITMAWYTGVSYVRIHNSKSNSEVFSEKIKEETKKLNAFYNVSIDGEEVTIDEVKNDRQVEGMSLKKVAKDLIRPAYRYFIPLKEEVNEEKLLDIPPQKMLIQEEKIPIQVAFIKAQQWMTEKFKSSSNEFYNSLTYLDKN